MQVCITAASVSAAIAHVPSVGYAFINFVDVSIVFLALAPIAVLTGLSPMQSFLSQKLTRASAGTSSAQPRLQRSRMRVSLHCPRVYQSANRLQLFKDWRTSPRSSVTLRS